MQLSNIYHIYHTTTVMIFCYTNYNSIKKRPKIFMDLLSFLNNNFQQNTLLHKIATFTIGILLGFGLVLKAEILTYFSPIVWFDIIYSYYTNKPFNKYFDFDIEY